MVALNVNGRRREVSASPDMPLLWVLRDLLNITGPKFGCGVAMCGACTIEVDGKMTRSCTLPFEAVEGATVQTIEAMSSDALGRTVQAAWRDLEVAQCGYCQSGQIMAAIGLLRDLPSPTDADIDDVMSGFLCRCATYPRIRAAIHQAARNMPADTRAKK